MRTEQILIAAILSSVASAAGAQVTAATFDSRASNRVWASVGLGEGSPTTGVPGSNGIGGELEAAYAHGPFWIAFNETSASDFGGNTKRFYGGIAGLAVRSGPLQARAGMGRGAIDGCVSEGEQSGDSDCGSEHAHTAFEAGVDLIPTSIIGLYASWVRFLGAPRGFHAITVGVAIGKLR